MPLSDIGIKEQIVRPLLHISGSRGLVYNKAGGALTNGSTGAKNVLDYQGIFKPTLAGEIRFNQGNRFENILPVASNVHFGSTVVTSPAPTNGVLLVNCPGGFTSGFQMAAGCTGRLQRNITIPADTARYEVSLIAYNTAPGGGARVAFELLGLFGGPGINAGGYYDFDTGESTIPLSGIGVEDLGGNYYRFFNTFLNAGERTIFQLTLTGASTVPGVEKVIFTGVQLLRYPSELYPTGVLRAPIVGKGLASPYYGAGVDTVRYLNSKKPPYSNIKIFGDSIPGAAGYTWANWFIKKFGRSSSVAVGGTRSTAIKDTVLADTTIATDICVVNAGTNDIIVDTLSGVTTTILDNFALIRAAIPHDRYIFVGPITYIVDSVYGSAKSTVRIAIDEAMESAYPGHYISAMNTLLAALDLTNPDEAAAYALGQTTTDMQSDNLHPSARGQKALVTAIWNKMYELGFFEYDAISTVPSIMHEPATTNLALLPRDLTNAAYVKTDCTAAKTATGTDGVVNSASTLTATAANATCLQTITSASSERITGAFIKRRTGTGVIEITQDNGSTWTQVTVPEAWGAEALVIPSATLADPVFGFRIVTSGDAIDVDWVQHELGSHITSPISGSRTIDSIKVPASTAVNFNQDNQITIVKLKMNFASSAGNKALFAANTGATDFIYDNGGGDIALSDGVNTATAALGGWSAGDTLLIFECHDSAANLMSVHVKKNSEPWVDSADTTYDGAFSIGDDLLLASANTDSIEFYHVSTNVTNLSHSEMVTFAKTNVVARAT